MKVAIIGNSGSGKSRLAQTIANGEPHKFGSKAEQDKKLDFLLRWVREYYTRDGSLSLCAHEAMFERYQGPKRPVTSQLRCAADVLGSSTERV